MSHMGKKYCPPHPQFVKQMEELSERNAQRIEKWANEDWVAGQYKPSDSFKTIDNHSCVCKQNDLGLISLSGAADDEDSQKLSDLISQAPKLYVLLDLINRSTKLNVPPTVINSIEETLKRARGEL